MTRDDILRLVEESGFDLNMFSPTGRDFFERFAELVAAAERERSVKVVEKWLEETFDEILAVSRQFRLAEREKCAMVVEENAKACVKDSLMYKVLMSNAIAIRARGSDPCPECGGAGIILVPNTDVMPCPHCLSNNPTG